MARRHSLNIYLAMLTAYTRASGQIFPIPYENVIEERKASPAGFIQSQAHLHDQLGAYQYSAARTAPAVPCGFEHRRCTFLTLLDSK